VVKRAGAAFVVVVTMLAIGLPAQIAGAHEFRVKPKIKLDKIPNGMTDPGERVVIAGDIKGKRLCRQDRVVTLKVVQPGPNQVLDTDRSDNDGEFRFVLRPQDDLTVFAKIRRLVERSYNHRHVCRRARSELLDINVR
jgi:hypothetical protein